MKMPTYHKNERGVALVISLMFLVILGMLGTTAYVMTSTDLKIGSNYQAGAEAFFDADAGIHYGASMIEVGVAAGSFTLPTAIGDPTDPSDTNSTPMTSFTAPTGFNFSFQNPGLTKVADMQYQFTCIGAGTHNSTATITATVKRKSAIQFGAFGDKKLDMGNTAAVYSYSHTSNPSPTPGTSTREGDVGSNESVILRNNSIVDGDVALGEDVAGTDAALTDLGGVVSGTKGEDIDRVDPDPLGVVGGEYAAKFTTYSVTNDNATHAVVAPGDSITTTGTSLTVGPNETLTLKGQVGGSNFYWHDVLIKSNFLYIDTTNGPVNIYVTGTFDANNGSQVINTTDSTCSTNGGTPATSTCACCCPNTCTRGKPGDFAIFANSTTSTDKISIGNSVEYSGLIYAPYITVRMDNSADIYGAIVGKEVEIINSVSIYYDTDLADQYASKDFELTTWRDVRN